MIVRTVLATVGPLEVRPEDAGVDQLGLDMDQRVKARAVIAKREADLRAHVVDSIDRLKEITDATKAGDKDAAYRLTRQMYESFDPEHVRDPLMAPLAAVLTDSQTAELKRLMDEYWVATIEAQVRAAPRQERTAIEQRLIYEQYQRELQRTFQHSLVPMQQRLEAIYQAVEPTPEQRARAIYGALDEERRIKLVATAMSAM